ncbi:hypothetical protein FG386_003150 [Cryptosporidium ryanae]|uniref:uncharacterized protein n=1 Tax=Cryptosporidium ryanae TaxID=515981 RepID=UPI003519DA95|nr:hypothetical protein FG386_003150 [Cryptosporidium ryanae]
MVNLFFAYILYFVFIVGVNCGFSDFFDPTSLLTNEHVSDSLIDSWEDPLKYLSLNKDNIFFDLLNQTNFMEIKSLFPLNPLNSISEEVIIRCVKYEGIIYNPEICPNLECNEMPLSTDYKYYNSSSSSTIRVSLSEKNFLLGSAIYTFETSIIQSISLINKFVVNFKVENPESNCKISIRLVELSYREESSKPILRGSSFSSVEVSIVPGKTFYSVDIVGLFSSLPNEFDITKITILVSPSTSSMKLNFINEVYSVARFYLNIDSIPFYSSGGIGERAIQQNRLIQAKSYSVFGRSIIDPDSAERSRFNDYCPKVMNGQCLVQITSLGTTKAIGIFGFQLSLAGVAFSIRRAKIYVPVSVFKNKGSVSTNIYISLLRPNFSVVKLNYNEFRKSFDDPLNTIKVPFSLESGIKTLIVDITRLFNGLSNLSLCNVYIALYLPDNHIGAIFTSNKAKITYQYDPSSTYQSMVYLNSTTFSNPSIASASTVFLNESGNVVNYNILGADSIISNQKSISGNSALVSQFSVPFITTQSLLRMNFTLVEKSTIDSNEIQNEIENQNNLRNNSESDLTVYETIEYTLNLVRPTEILSIGKKGELETISSLDFKLKIGGQTRVDVLELVFDAIKRNEFNMGLISFLVTPKSDVNNKNLSLSLPFLEIMWSPGLALSNGKISGGSHESVVNNKMFGQLERNKWTSSSTTSVVNINSVGLILFDFSKIPCLNTITSANAIIEFSKFTSNGEFNIFLMDQFDWDSSFTKENQSFFDDPTKEYSKDTTIPPTLLSIPLVVNRDSTMSIEVSLLGILGFGATTAIIDSSKTVIAISTNSNDSELSMKSMKIEIRCSLNDGVYYDTAII